MKYQWFYDELFGRNFTVFYKPDPNKLEQFILKHFNWQVDLSKYKNIPKNRSMASTIQTPCAHTLLVFWNTKEFSVIAHEANHASFEILNNAGISLSQETEEIFCYYQEFIIKKTQQAINKLK